MNHQQDTRQANDNPQRWRTERDRIRAEVKADVEALRADAAHLAGDVREGARSAGQFASTRWADRRARSTGVMATARDNPIPTAMIGVGLGWLVWRTIQDRGESSLPTGEARHEGQSSRARVDELRHEAKQSVTQIKQTAASTAQDMRQRAQSQMHTARERSSSLYEENPLAFAGAAALAGVGIGMLLPVSQREQEMYGPLRDRAVSQTKEKVVQKVEQAEHAAKAAGEVLKQGLGAGNGPRESEAH